MHPVSLALFAGLDAVLQCQNRLIRRDQALAAGVNEATVESLVSRGHWKRILPRVYSLGADLGDPAVLIRAGWLWAGEDSLVASHAGAWWLGLTDRPPPLITLVVPPARRMSARPGYAIVRARVDQTDVVEWNRVAVTSPARTCLDLARLGEADHLETALRLRKLTQQQLQVSLDLGRGTRGQRRARAVRAAVVESPWSNPERAAHELFRKARITGWTGNSAVVVKGGVRFPDIVFDDIKLVVEIDGRAHHSDAEAFEADRWRQNQFVEAGWTVLRFTPAQLANDPGAVISSVRATVARLRSARPE